MIIQTKNPFPGVIFDEDQDHDFEGPRAPKAHLDTVLTKPVAAPVSCWTLDVVCLLFPSTSFEPRDHVHDTV